MKCYLAILCILLVGCTTTSKVGVDKDSHGCLTTGGFSWDEYVGACVRELDDEQKEAAKIAIAPISFGPVSIEGVEKGRCEGCFMVEFRSTDEGRPARIVLENWQVVREDGLSNADCRMKGGNVVEKCSPEETLLGKVADSFCCAAIESFEDCEKAGFPIMESYPRQCNAEGKTFVERTGSLTYEEAKAFAEGTDCTKYGNLTSDYFYNENTRTWWISLDMNGPYKKVNCAPACVVSENIEAAEISWRCTGAVPPSQQESLKCMTRQRNSMTLIEAREIADRSECFDAGVISGGVCNTETGTWWLDLDVFEPREGCSPACVIDIDNARAGINWRCTGLI